MSRFRSKLALALVAGALSLTVGALGAHAKPGKGKHGPCERGKHRGNKHCKVVSPSPSTSAPTTEAPTPVPTETTS